MIWIRIREFGLGKSESGSDLKSKKIPKSFSSIKNMIFKTMLFFVIYKLIIQISYYPKKLIIFKNNTIFLYFWSFLFSYPDAYQIHFPISQYRSGQMIWIRPDPNPQHCIVDKQKTIFTWYWYTVQQ